MSQPIPQSDTSPIPVPDASTAAFWTALAEDRLLLRGCEVCGTSNHPAASSCRRCDSPQLGWREVPRRGRLFSWTIEVRPVIAGMTPPYVIAQLTPEGCDEGGVRLVGTLLTEAPDELVLGLPLAVSVTERPGSPVPLLVFRPA